MRMDAEWMNRSDDRILELLRDHGNLTPKAVENLDGPAQSTCQNRLPVLRKYGLVELVANTTGLYRITDEGEAYLDEELDASELVARSPTDPDAEPAGGNAGDDS
jgi:hypothetical protein